MAKNKHVFVKIEKFKFPDIGVGVNLGAEEPDEERVTAANSSVSSEKAEVKRALPGQIVRARLKRGKGQLLNVWRRAASEVPPLCPNTGSCGGCTFQTLPYEDELKIKSRMVTDLFANNRIELPEGPENPNIIPAPNVYGYRNKMEFSFGDEYKNGPLSLGLRNPGSYYEVCNGALCNICHEDLGEIVEAVRGFFKEKGAGFYHRTLNTGHLRHLVLRRAEYTGEILVNLVTADGAVIHGFSEALLGLELKGRIVSILHTLNSSVADVVLPDKVEVLYGKDFFYETCLDLRFKIYPFSFFQTNTKGAERLYTTVSDFVGDERAENIFDLYCGTGTIAQILSPKAGKVYGIEIVESAVRAAIENAALNNTDNCEFIAGDVLREVPKLAVSPDVIILDPPREGIHPKAIEPIINFGAKKIVYVSCKPTSLVRDLQVFLDRGYGLSKFRVHDMFPRSYHVECVALLTLGLYSRLT